MYRIYADSTLIYDSTVEDYKIGKGEINLKIDKAGSFTFSMYPDNPYYDRIVKMKTIIVVYRDDEIIFRGRALKAEDGFYNDRVVTCEGELNFLLDSIIRPWTFSGSPKDLFTKFITEHNAQVDAEKRFKIGAFTAVDNNDYTNVSNIYYQDAYTNIQDHMIGLSLGGHLLVTHEEDGTPVINYYGDFPDTASQRIEFGENLKDYTRTANAEDIATVLIPLGARLKDADGNDTDEYLTITSVNGGKDYIENADAIAIYGRIVKSVVWEDVTVASRLLTKGRQELANLINQNVTIDLTAIDLHLLDRSIESFHYAEYIPIYSEPHGLNVVMLCKKQTIDLLKPDNDSLSLGYSCRSLTETSAAANKSTNNVNAQISSIIVSVNNAITEVTNLNDVVAGNTTDIAVTSEDLEAVVRVVQQNTNDITEIVADVQTLQGDVEAVATVARDSALKASDAQTRATNAETTANAAAGTVGQFDNRISALEDLGLFVGEDGGIYQEYEED